MFDLDAGKLVIVGVAALVFIPAKDLPRVLRQVGQFVGKMRRMANDFQGQFMDAMREADMADLRREAQKLADSARVETGLGSIGNLDLDLARPIERKSLDGAAPTVGRVESEGEAGRILADKAGSTEIPAPGSNSDSARVGSPVPY